VVKKSQTVLKTEPYVVYCVTNIMLVLFLFALTKHNNGTVLIFLYSDVITVNILILYIILMTNVIFTEEDVHNKYGKLVLKYFVAEGIINKHEIFFASAECKPESVLQVCVTRILNYIKCALPLIIFRKCCSVVLAVCRHNH